MYKKAYIFGIGMIGGSIAHSLKDNKISKNIYDQGIDDLTPIADRIDKLNAWMTKNSSKITQRSHITKGGKVEKINPKTTKEMEDMLQELNNINKGGKE